MEFFPPTRKSYTSLGEIYFWTATIHQWLPLLEPDENKQLIIDYLKKLADAKRITVYGFVIMPNHILLIWQQTQFNGKETTKGSLLKHTGHELLKQLKALGKSSLYKVIMANKKHEIWQRDSLGIKIFTKKVALQKLNYIHQNPLKGKWNLSKDDISYPFSHFRGIFPLYKLYFQQPESAVSQ